MAEEEKKEGKKEKEIPLSTETLCSEKAEFRVEGTAKVFFGNGCVIHPKAKITVEGDCSLYFGEYNIIEENASIVVKPRFSSLLNNYETITIYIGNYNHFKAGCYIENTTIENSNVFGYKCRLEDSFVQSGVNVNACVQVPKKTNIENQMIVLSGGIMKNNKYYKEEDFNNQIKGMYKNLYGIFKSKLKLKQVEATPNPNA